MNKPGNLFDPADIVSGNFYGPEASKSMKRLLRTLVRSEPDGAIHDQLPTFNF